MRRKAAKAASPTHGAPKVTTRDVARQGPLELFHQFVHPEDRDLVFSTIDTAREGTIDGWKQELRVRMANGEWCWMQLRAQAIAANAIARS